MPPFHNSTVRPESMTDSQRGDTQRQQHLSLYAKETYLPSPVYSACYSQEKSVPKLFLTGHMVNIGNVLKTFFINNCYFFILTWPAPVD